MRGSHLIRLSQNAAASVAICVRYYKMRCYTKCLRTSVLTLNVFLTSYLQHQISWSWLDTLRKQIHDVRWNIEGDRWWTKHLSNWRSGGGSIKAINSFKRLDKKGWLFRFKKYETSICALLEFVCLVLVVLKSIKEHFRSLSNPVSCMACISYCLLSKPQL